MRWTLTDDLRDLGLAALLIRNAVQDREQRLRQVEQLTEAVEAEVDEMPRQLHHLQHAPCDVTNTTPTSR